MATFRVTHRKAGSIYIGVAIDVNNRSNVMEGPPRKSAAKAEDAMKRVLRNSSHSVEPSTSMT